MSQHFAKLCPKEMMKGTRTPIRVWEGNRERMHGSQRRIYAAALSPVSVSSLAAMITSAQYRFRHDEAILKAASGPKMRYLLEIKLFYFGPRLKIQGINYFISPLPWDLWNHTLLCRPKTVYYVFKESDFWTWWLVSSIPMCHEDPRYQFVAKRNTLRLS